MKTSTHLVLRGLLAIVVGLVAVVWPGITIGAFLLLFAVYALLAAAMQIAAAFRSRRGGSVVGRILLAVIDIAAAVTALTWPAITALALTLVVAGWALIAGAIEVVLAFAAGQTAGQRALYALTGIVSVVLGVVFVLHPDIAAVTLAQVYGLSSIVSGVAGLVLASNLPRPVATTQRQPHLTPH